MNTKCFTVMVGGVLSGAASIALDNQAAAATQVQGHTASAECSARGKTTVRISRARAAGATPQRQLAKIDSKKLPVQQAAQGKRLLNSNSGPAAAIHADSEAQRMAEKSKLMQALLLAAAAGKFISEAQSDSELSAEADQASAAELDQMSGANQRSVAEHGVRKRNCPQRERDSTRPDLDTSCPRVATKTGPQRCNAAVE